MRLTLFLWHLWIHHQGVRGRREGEEEGREGGGRLNIMMMLRLMVAVAVMAVVAVAVYHFVHARHVYLIISYFTNAAEKNIKNKAHTQTQTNDK